LTDGVTNYYPVTASNLVGESGRSAVIAATPQAAADTLLWAVAAGGAGAGLFQADTAFVSGKTYRTTAPIDLSAVANPAPQSVYQSERYGNFTYTVDGLTPGAVCTVRLHFAENYWSGAGRRLFHVAINGTQAIANPDIFAAAGGKDRALVREVTATANSQGALVIQFQNVRDNAKVNGIEVRSATAGTVTSRAIDSSCGSAGSFVADRGFQGRRPRLRRPPPTASTTYRAISNWSRRHS
jgi:hypothetical protein